MRSTPNEWRRLRWAAGCAALLTAGCAVGPNFKPPPAPDATGYTVTRGAHHRLHHGCGRRQAQRFHAGASIPADWWRLFHSQPLDALVAAALRNNPDLRGGAARP